VAAKLRAHVLEEQVGPEQGGLLRQKRNRGLAVVEEPRPVAAARHFREPNLFDRSTCALIANARVSVAVVHHRVGQLGRDLCVCMRTRVCV
jgi:hypothetical protein